MNAQWIAQFESEVCAAHAEPLGRLLGWSAQSMIVEQVRQVAPGRVLPLSDPDEGYDTALGVMDAIFGDADPEPQWWGTPLGRACGAALGQDGAEVTHSQAAAILGVSRGTISQLVARGTLPRHPHGGVAREAVLRRERERTARVNTPSDR